MVLQTIGNNVLLPLLLILKRFHEESESEAQPGSDSDSDSDSPHNWYGNIQYLINISVIGAICCVFLFLVVKLRSDHKYPGPKLLSVWHATGAQIGILSGANAPQFLAVEAYTFLGFLAISLVALLVLLPLNIYGGSVPLQDQFSRSTVIHIEKASTLLWWHYAFMVLVVCIMHLCIRAIYGKQVSSTRPDGDCVSAFTLMVHRIPRSLSANKTPLQDFFEHRYPGKVFRVVVPPDLSTFYALERRLIKTRKHLSWLMARERDRIFVHEEEEEEEEKEEEEEARINPKVRVDGIVNLIGATRTHRSWLRQSWRACKSVLRQVWVWFLACGGCGEDDIIAKLHEQCLDLESKLLPYKEGTAGGAGIAFVVFRDLRTASRALQDIRSIPKGGNMSTMDLELGKGRWKVERAPPARDIYWHHLGSTTLSRVVRRVIVNTVLLMLLFFLSSPLAVLTALHNVGRLINPEAMDHLHTWLVWVQSSSWAAAIIVQFLPNLLVFVSMYFVIPATLAYLSSFESHLTLSGEQRAALAKTVLFFLVNLIILRGLLETSLESMLLHVKDCYEEGTACKDIEQYMSSSFLANSCLSATAFLITSAFLGISYDLLAPIPWIKRKIQQLKRERPNPFSSGEPPSMDYDNMMDEESLQEQLLPSTTRIFNFPESERSGSSSVANSMGIDVEEHDDLRIGRENFSQWQSFDYVQYYAFNLTIFAMALIYSSFVPVIVPIAALYFGYRYFVDKYNFLFMYRAWGCVATNDGKLLGTVIRVMKLCIILYLFAMLYFFYFRGDQEKLQFLCTLVVVVLVCAKYGIEKLICPSEEGFHVSVLESLGSVENYVNGPLEYEVFALPNFDWSTFSDTNS